MKKILIILIFLIFIVIVIISNKKEFNILDISTNIFYNDQYSEEEYYGYLLIPSISLNLGFYGYDSKLNDVELNVEIIKIPVSGSYLLAAHSGIGSKAYFNDLASIAIGDDIYLTIEDNTTHYQVTNIYREIKDGDISISNQSGLLYLTTCDQIVSGYQLVVVATIYNN